MTHHIRSIRHTLTTATGDALVVAGLVAGLVIWVSLIADPRTRAITLAGRPPTAQRPFSFTP